jgi:hypothetical protein
LDPTDKSLDLLAQLVKWTREAALPNVRKRVDASLDTEIKLRVYHALSDGTMTPRKLEDAHLGVSRDSAQRLVEEWEALGLVDAGSNPPKASFTLAEFGIVPPRAARPESKKSAK